MANELKCIHCIEIYVQLPEDKQNIENWDAVQDAVTLVPSWQLNSFAPGQMAAACVSVPVCLEHIQIKKPSPGEVANRSGLAIPGTPGFN